MLRHVHAFDRRSLRRPRSSWLCPGVALAVLTSIGVPLSARADEPSGSRATRDILPAHETRCDDRIDEDGDSVTDCADADCYDSASCKASSPETSEAACSDFVDNDKDGSMDCEDADCWVFQALCGGSWRSGETGVAPGAAGVAVAGTSTSTSTTIRPSGSAGSTGETLHPRAGSRQEAELTEGIDRIEDLLGRGSDADGERTDEACVDGIDNDLDGKTDCDDLGCRFSPDVSVCRAAPGLRLALYADVSQSHEFVAKRWDTTFRVLQLRAFGPFPLLQDSFFLLSARMENTPRLSFAFFTMPIYGDHRITVSSGGARLSSGPVLSIRKNVLIDAANYLYSAFEQGNGAALEVDGPIVEGTLGYRVFGAGGTGQYSGNVGGRYYRSDDRNYTWAAGAQAQYFPLGHFDDDDSRYLYRPSSLALSVYAGGKYEQRAAERFPAANLHLLFRWSILTATLEGYAKRELEFESWQFSYNAMLGVLVLPRWLFIAGDVGQFYATNFEKLPAIVDDALGSELRRIQDELQWRVGLHLYLWRTNGILSLLYVDRFIEGHSVETAAEQAIFGSGADTRTRTLRADLQFGF